MGSFDAEKGLFHFVFANENDFYYTPSGVRLPLVRYLYNELVKAGYQSIYFISGDSDCHRVVMMNENLYEITDIKGGTMQEGFLKHSFFRQKTKKLQGEYDRCIELKGAAEYNDFMLRMTDVMRDKKRNAFVFSLDAFNDVGQMDKVVQSLNELAQKNSRAGYQHIIVITASNYAGGSMDLFKDKSGIFRSELFPEINRIFAKGRNVYFYDELKNEYGERAVFLNDFSREMINNILLRHFLKNVSCIADEFSALDNMAEFIAKWYDSEAVRNRYGKLFSDNPKRQLLLMEKDLEDKVIFSKVEEYASDENLNVLRSVRDDVRLLPVYHNDSRVEKVTKIYRAVCDCSAPLNEKSTVRKILVKVINNLKKPGIVLYDDFCTEKYFEKFLQYAQSACSSTGEVDMVTVDKAAKAMCYALETLFTTVYDETALLEESSSAVNLNDSCLELYLRILKITSLIHGFENDCKVLEYDINRTEAELEEAFEDSEQFMRFNRHTIDEMNSLSPGDDVSAELLELGSKRERVLSLKRSLDSKQGIRLKKLEFIQKLKAAVVTMENGLDMSFADNSKDLRESVGSANHVVNSLKNSERLLSEITTENNSFNEVVTEAYERRKNEVKRAAGMVQHSHKSFEDEVAEAEQLQEVINLL